MRSVQALALVLIALGASAIVLPALADQAGARPPAAPGAAPQSAACPHTIDPARCPFCTPSLVESDGFCRGHGVPEAHCVKCRPFLKAAFIAAGDWCAEHNTPESQCALCGGGPAAATGDHGAVEGHNHAPSSLPADGPRWRRPPSPGCVTSSTVVTLSSPEAARAAGLRYITVEPATLARTVVRNAELHFNANRYARLSSRTHGVIAEVVADLGDAVRTGDTLALIDSVDLGAAKSDLLRAIETGRLWEANAARERTLVSRGVGVEREALEAETRAAECRIDVNRARQRLRNLGLTEAQVAAVERDNDTSSLLAILAPFDGAVVERAAVLGESAEPGAPLFAITDTTSLWAMIDLFESDLSTVAPGASVRLSLDGVPGSTFDGRLSWISTQIDHRTRTLRARAEIDNSSGLLRANMFGKAAVQIGPQDTGLSVPKDAVQWEGCCNIAFIREGGNGVTFRPARLLLSHDAGDRYLLASGLNPGDVVVTSGSFILKNEVLKNSVGAGCCEVDHLAK